MSAGLTPQMAAMIDAIRSLTANGVSPSLEELRAELGFAHRGAVHRLLRRLQDRGVVTWEPTRKRSLRILDDQFSTDDLRRMSSEALERVLGTAFDILEERGRL